MSALTISHLLPVEIVLKYMHLIYVESALC